MKKHKIAALALCAVLMLALAGCTGLFGKGKEVAGSWRTLRVDATDSACKNGRVNVELKTFGGATIEVIYGDGSEDDGTPREGKWKVKDGDVVCTFEEGDDVVLTRQGEELVYADGKFTAYMEHMVAEVSDEDEEDGAKLKNFLKRLLDL